MSIRANALHPDPLPHRTPSRQAKAAGLKNLTQVSNLTGVSLNTLTNWHRDKQKLFAMVIEGCVSHQAKKTA